MTENFHKKLLLAVAISGAVIMQAGCMDSSSGGENPSVEPPANEQPGDDAGGDDSSSPQPDQPGDNTGSAEAIEVYFSAEVDGQWQACAAVEANVLHHDRHGNLKGTLVVGQDGGVDISAMDQSDFVTIANETDSSVTVMSAEVALLSPGLDLFVAAYDGARGDCFGDDAVSEPAPSFEVEVNNATDFTYVAVEPVWPGGTATTINADFSGPIVLPLKRLERPYDVLAIGYNRPLGSFIERMDKYEVINSQLIQDGEKAIVNPVREPVAIPLLLTTPQSASESVNVKLYSPESDQQYFLENIQIGLVPAKEVRTIESDASELILTRIISNWNQGRRIIAQERFANDVTSISMPDKDLNQLTNVVMGTDTLSYSFVGDGAPVVVAGGIRVYEPSETSPIGAKAVQLGVFTRSATGEFMMPTLPSEWMPAEPFQNTVVKVVTSDSTIQIFDHMALSVMELVGNTINSSVLDAEVLVQLDTVSLSHRLFEPYTEYRVSSK
jgi:hypothetical protein